MGYDKVILLLTTSVVPSLIITVTDQCDTCLQPKTTLLVDSIRMFMPCLCGVQLYSLTLHLSVGLLIC